MSADQLNLEDFPNSAYADELRRGLKRMRFEAPLEQEYLFAHLQRVQLRVRMWFSVNFVLSLLFTFERVHNTGIWNLESLAHLGVLVPSSSALFWLAWSRYYHRWFMAAAPMLVGLFCVSISAFVAQGLTAGRDEELAALAVQLIAVYFFTGLMFRQSLMISGAMLTSFTAAAATVGMGEAMLLKSLAVMVVTSGIAAIVYRDAEKVSRRSFLEGALIGELVGIDALSGLMNRRTFDEHLLRVWQHALRDQRAIAILMVDIDHFKQYNDNFGHQAGDAALRGVAQIVKGFARRPLDLAARFGGEEFAVILYDLALPHVRDTAERLLEAVQNLNLTVLPGRDARAAPEVTVSVGVGLAAPTIGRTPQGAVQLADEALYEAKHLGRNCVAVKGTEAYLLLETGAFNSQKLAAAPQVRLRPP